jgi:hypothetical protein
MFKKLGSLLLAVTAIAALAACTDLSNEVSGYYVSVDINPSIEFIVDEENVVESFIFLNEDAAVLCVDLDFIGMTVDDAIELFIETATEAGYVDPEGDDNAVLITVLGEDGEDEYVEAIKERLRQRVIRHFAKNYINGVVLTEDFTQEDLVAEAEALGVTPGKLKLAYAAIVADDTLVLEDLLEMPVKDILAVVRELHDEEWEQYKLEQMEQLRSRLQERIDANQDRLDQFIANHPELTEEEIDAIIAQRQQQVREETRETWQQRIEQWKEAREQNNNSETDPQENQST